MLDTGEEEEHIADFRESRWCHEKPLSSLLGLGHSFVLLLPGSGTPGLLDSRLMSFPGCTENRLGNDVAQWFTAFSSAH